MCGDGSCPQCDPANLPVCFYGPLFSLGLIWGLSLLSSLKLLRTVNRDGKGHRYMLVWWLGMSSCIHPTKCIYWRNEPAACPSFLMEDDRNMAILELYLGIQCINMEATISWPGSGLHRLSGAIANARSCHFLSDQAHNLAVAWEE